MNKGELNNANNVPSLSNILNNHVIIQSHTTINKDGRLQSYCGLKLINILEIGEPSHLVITQTSDRQEAHYVTSGEPSHPVITQTSDRQEAHYSTSNNQPSTSTITSAGRRRIRQSRKIPKHAALTSSGVHVSYAKLGPPSYQCSSCDANMWYEERVNKAKRSVNASFSLCCQEGKLLLPKFKEAPLPLKTLLDFSNPTTARFREQIRVYNGMFTFTSFAARIDQRALGKG